MSLSKRTLREIRDLLNGMRYVRDGSRLWDTSKYVQAIDAHLKPKRSARPARQRREVKRQTRKERTAAVRAAVVDRAGGHEGACCEACGGKPYGGPLELDHFHSGAHKRPNETVEGCWLLCRRCHRQKTDNNPSRLHWLTTFRNHCQFRGYTHKARETERLINAEHDKARLPFSPTQSSPRSTP